MIKKIFLPIITQATSMYIISLIMNNIHINTLESLIKLTVIFSILNITLKPILKILSLPITLLTLGLSRLIINGVVLYVAFTLVSDAYINGIGTAIVASILISIVNTLLDIILG